MGWRRQQDHQRRKQPRRQRRRKGRNLHHLTPRSRGGKNSESNELLIDIERHFQWHVIFGNSTLEEVIALLQRVQRAKKFQETGKLPETRRHHLRLVAKA